MKSLLNLVDDSSAAQRKKPVARTQKVKGDHAKVWKLLSERDVSVVQQGLELLRALAEPEAFDDLLAEVTVHSETGALERGARFTGSGPAQPSLDVALLGALSLAPTGSAAATVRASVRRLEATVAAAPMLAGFDALQALVLHLPVGFAADNLAGFGPLPALTSLVIGAGERKRGDWGARTLRSLDGLVAPALEVAKLHHLALSSVDALSASPRLREVHLGLNPELTSIAGLAASRDTLEVADLSLERDSNSPGVGVLDPIGGASRLKHLGLKYQSSLTSLQPLARCSSLHWVTLHGCSGLTSLSGLDGKIFTPPSDEDDAATFSLWSCGSLTSLRGLPAFGPSVTKLACDHMGSLADLSGVEVATGVTSFSAKYSAVEDLSPLGKLPALRKLSIDGSESLAKLPATWASPGLDELSLDHCPALTSIAGLRGTMSTLDLSGCDGIVSLSGLAGFPSLESLILGVNVSDLGAAVPKGLSIGVILGDAKSFPSALAKAIRGVPELRLSVNNEPGARWNRHGDYEGKDLSALGSLTNVVELDVAACTAFDDLSWLCALPNLRCLRFDPKSPAGKLAKAGLFDTRAEVAKLQTALAKRYGVALAAAAEAPKAKPLSKETAKKAKELKAALSGGDVEQAVEALAALAEAGEAALYDALSAGLDPQGAFKRNSRADSLGSAMKSVKVAGLPLARHIMLALLAAAPDEAVSTVALRSAVTEIELEADHAALALGLGLPPLAAFTTVTRAKIELKGEAHTPPTKKGKGKAKAANTKAPAAVVDLSFVGNLPALQALTLAAFPELCSLAGIERCPLEGLSIRNCPALTDLSALAGKRVHGSRWGTDEDKGLELDGAGVLADVSFLAGMTIGGLSLRVDGSADLAPLARVSGLESLALSIRGETARVPALLAEASLTSLTKLKLHRASDDDDSDSDVTVQVRPAPQPALTELDLSGCVTDFSALGATPLNEVHLLNVNLPSLTGLGKVSALRLHDCKVASLAGLEKSPLDMLNLDDVEGLRDVGALRSMVSLRKLVIGNGTGVSGKDLEGLTAITGLQWLKYSGSLAFLGTLTGLEEIYLNDAGNLTDLEALSKLPALKKVYLRGAATKRDAWPEALQRKLDYVTSDRLR